MSKITFIVILVLSIVVTYGVAMGDALKRDSLVAGSAGLPFKFASGSLFGEPSTNYLTLLIDVLFWYLIIWLVWVGFKHLQKRKK